MKLLPSANESPDSNRGGGQKQKIMKKLIALIILTVITVTGCSSTKGTASSLQKESEGLVFEYTAMTRGTYKNVVVTPYQITTSQDADKKNSVTKQLVAEEWKKLYEAYKSIKDVKTIGDIQAPTKKHQYDGALAASLTIKMANQVYSSPTFDHGNPPAEIKALTDEIVTLSDLNKTK